MGDDAIRETHGCKCAQTDVAHEREVLVSETDALILLRLGHAKAKLTRWQARYLATKLYRLSRRIRDREVIEQMTGNPAKVGV